jgi:Leucine-rich repeat (LRR) protein
MRSALPLLVLWTIAALSAPTTDPAWVSDAGGVLIKDAAGSITGVDLRSSWATDADLADLAKLPTLKTLDLSLSRISDRGMRSLRGATGIVDLNLYFAEQVTDEGMSAIKGWKNLKRLNVRGTKITDMTLEFVSTIPTLESLDVGYAEITDVGLDHLTSLPNLRALTIGGNKLTDMGVHLLRQMPQLTYLDIGGSQRTDSGLWSVSLTESGVESMATLVELRELRLAGTPVSGRSMEKLKALVKLERLVLQNCKRIADDSVPILSSFATLRVLDVKGTAITEQGAATLKKNLPNAQVLY